MDRKNLIRKLEAMLDQMERDRAFGAIEIEVRDGSPKFINKTSKELIAENEPRARQTYR